MTILMIIMLEMVTRAMGWLIYSVIFCFKTQKSLQIWTGTFCVYYYSLKCVLLCCNSVLDVAELKHILSAFHRCCRSKLPWGYSLDMVYYWRCIWCIITLNVCTSVKRPLHYMKSNRCLYTSRAICWGNLSDFRCNNCQRNKGVNQKASSSDSDKGTLWRKQKDWTDWEYQISHSEGLHLSV